MPDTTPAGMIIFCMAAGVNDGACLSDSGNPDNNACRKIISPIEIPRKLPSKNTIIGAPKSIIRVDAAISGQNLFKIRQCTRFSQI